MNTVQSIELAYQIIAIAKVIQDIDHDYLRESVKEFKKQANFQDSVAVLNPRYSRERSDLVHKQAEALAVLDKYVDLLKEIDVLKLAAAVNDADRQKIENLFLF